MANLLVRPQARTDLDEIWLYIAQDNIERADHFIDLIEEKALLLVEQPMIGQKREKLLPGLRSFPVGKYMMFYVPIDNGIELVRVLHASRDISAMF